MTPEAAKLIGAGLSATIHINNELVHHRTLVEIPPGFPVVERSEKLLDLKLEGSILKPERH